LNKKESFHLIINLDKMIDKEELVELHIVLDMVEKVMDKLKDV
jgi:hypothetical protein